MGEYESLIVHQDYWQDTTVKKAKYKILRDLTLSQRCLQCTQYKQQIKKSTRQEVMSSIICNDRGSDYNINQI